MKKKSFLLHVLLTPEANSNYLTLDETNERITDVLANLNTKFRNKSRVATDQAISIRVHVPCYVRTSEKDNIRR
jgi:hypothetical protein